MTHVHEFILPPPSHDAETVVGICSCGETREFQAWGEGRTVDGKPLRAVTCVICSKGFMSASPQRAKYCSDPCRRIAEQRLREARAAS